MEESLCIVCQDSAREVRFHECGHSITCQLCTLKLIAHSTGMSLKCPTCKESVVRIEGWEEEADSSNASRHRASLSCCSALLLAARRWQAELALHALTLATFQAPLLGTSSAHRNAVFSSLETMLMLRRRRDVVSSRLMRALSRLGSGGDFTLLSSAAPVKQRVGWLQAHAQLKRHAAALIVQRRRHVTLCWRQLVRHRAARAPACVVLQRHARARLARQRVSRLMHENSVVIELPSTPQARRARVPALPRTPPP